jgi:hypothetical protein
MHEFQVGFTLRDLQEGHIGFLPMALNLLLQSRHSKSWAVRDSIFPISGPPPTVHIYSSPPILLYWISGYLNQAGVSEAAKEEMGNRLNMSDWHDPLLDQLAWWIGIFNLFSAL